MSLPQICKRICYVFICFVLIGCASSQSRKIKLQQIENKAGEVEEKLNQDLEPSTRYEKISPEEDKDIKITRKDDYIEFELDGTGFASMYVPSIEADRHAEEDALSKAIKKCGVNVYYGFQSILDSFGDTEREFIGRYINTWTTAIVEYDRIGEPIRVMKDDGLESTVKIKGKAYFRGDSDPGFKLKCEIDKPGYYEGDNINLKIISTRDAYINVLLIDEENRVYLIYPNTYAANAPIDSGEVLELPGELPVTLRAFLPEGQNKTRDIIHVIATKNQPLFSHIDTKQVESSGYNFYSLGDLNDISRRLAQLPRNQWTMYVQFYTIHRK